MSRSILRPPCRTLARWRVRFTSAGDVYRSGMSSRFPLRDEVLLAIIGAFRRKPGGRHVTPARKVVAAGREVPNRRE